MSDTQLYTRRRLLAAGTATVMALAGCTDSQADGTDGSGTRTTDTETESPTPNSPTETTTDPGTETKTPTQTKTPTETETDSVETVRDITFRETPERDLQLDLYLPREGSDHPFFVFAHGGAWIMGDKGERPMFDELATEGYAVADIQYRLAQEKQYPAAVRDVAAAVKWVKANAGQYEIDASMGALAGYSAGAHLATLVGLAPEHDQFQPLEFHPDVSPSVDAIVGYSGPYDFTEPGSGDNQLVRAFFGQDAGEETFAEGSPVSHVDGDDPPTLLFHGTDDGIVPYRSTTRLADVLRDAEVPVEVFTADGAGHGLINAETWREETLSTQQTFLEDHL